MIMCMDVFVCVCVYSHAQFPCNEIVFQRSNKLLMLKHVTSCVLHIYPFSFIVAVHPVVPKATKLNSQNHSFV